MTFDYNTQRKRMALPEYGRNVLKMIEHIKTIKDDEERNRAAKTIIQIMGNLNPNLRDLTDFKHKLWDHLMIIADFDLELDGPYPAPDKTKLVAKPNQVPYHNGEIKYAHYGRIIPLLIDAASEMDDGEELDYLITLVLNQMKKDYLIWNKGQVADELIIRDLSDISKGRLKAPENLKMLDVKDLLTPLKSKTQSRYQGRPQDKYKGRQGNPGKKKYKTGH
ncbi:MAG TPA: DUF4290 domain-containing protein, partial [Bacteroidales bacterium]|nr:DUF4290 domain-containing protein [Bacteroidales bacterium]